MEQLLPQVETANTVQDFAALYLKCTLDGKISQVLHSDFNGLLQNPEGEFFSSLFSGLSLVFATDFISEIISAGSASNYRLQYELPDKTITLGFNGIRTGKYLLINGLEQAETTPAGSKKAPAANQLLPGANQQTGAGTYEVILGKNNWRVSRQMYSLFGWEPDEVFTNESYLKIIHPDDLDALVADFQKSLKNDSTFRLLYRARHRGGNWLFISASGRIERDTNGKPARVLGIKQDISQHYYSMKDALRETEDLYKGIVNSSLDAIIVTNPAGTIIDWNPQASQIFGYSRTEALGQNLDQFLIPGIAQKLHCNDNQEANKIADGPKQRLEILARKKDGADFLAEVTLTVVKKNGTECLSAFVRNISDRRNTENLLLEKKKQLKEISSSIPGVVFQLRRSNTGRFFFTYISSRVEKYCGVPVHKCYSDINHLLAIICPADLPNLKLNVERSAWQLSSLLQVCRITNPETGELSYLQLHALPSVNENSDIVWNGTIINVTKASKVEEKLKVSEKQYRQLLETITEGVVVADRDDNVLLFNNQFCQLTGYTPKELEGSNFRQLLAAFDEDRKLIAEQNIDRWQGKSMHYDVRIRRKDDQLLWVRINAAPARDQNGNITGAIATLLDITQEKTAKEEMRKSEERYRRLFQSNPHPMFVYDRVSLRFLDVNQAAMKHYQYSEEEFLQMKRTALFTPEGVDVFEKVLYHAKGKEKYNHKTQHLRKNGELIDVQINACLFQNEDNNGVLVIAQDITEQKRAAFALQESEERYKSLFEQNPEPVFSIDGQGNIISANHAFANLLQTNVEDLLNRSYFDFLDQECHENCQSLFTKVMQGAAQTFYSVIINKKGKRAVVNMTLMPIKVNNKIVGAYCILKDETEVLRMNQELKKSHQELRELASHIHQAREEERKRIAREVHDELGQVLTALKIDISLLNRKSALFQEDLASEFNSTLNIADEALRSVKRIVTELRPIGLDELGLLNEIKLYAQRYQTRYGTKVTVEVPEKNLPIDRDKAIEIFRIIQESLTNVARHAQATEVIVRLTHDSERIVASVTDNGVGITNNGQKKEKSFGLIGMRERALMIGGSLSITAAEVRGTKVKLVLPLCSN